jgi:hypothetical protein
MSVKKYVATFDDGTRCFLNASSEPLAEILASDLSPRALLDIELIGEWWDEDEK